MGLACTSCTASNGFLRLPLPRLAEKAFFTGDEALRILTDDALESACATRIAFTMRTGGSSTAPFGSLNLSHAVGDDGARVDANRMALCDSLGVAHAAGDLFVPRQVHGTEFVEFLDADAHAISEDVEADGVVCTQGDLPVLLCFADCVPVILVAPGGAFAVVHSGWRGAVEGIAGLGLARLAKASGCMATEVNCYVGPHIGACCYEVDGDLLDRFTRIFGDGCDGGDGHLDLGFAVSESLLRAGADGSRIVDADMCTSCNVDRLYSYRAEHARTGRHGAFAIRKGES